MFSANLYSIHISLNGYQLNKHPEYLCICQFKISLFIEDYNHKSQSLHILGPCTYNETLVIYNAGCFLFWTLGICKLQNFCCIFSIYTHITSLHAIIFYYPIKEDEDNQNLHFYARISLKTLAPVSSAA